MDNIQHARSARDFLKYEALSATVGKDNTVLDASVLIGSAVKIGSGNVFYPGVVIEQIGQSTITIGNDNIFYPGTYMFASSGAISIGNGNEFGVGGCIVRSNMPDSKIAIGDGGRYSNGVNIMGATQLGSGSQVLGAITVQSCTLASGAGFQDSDPDKRAAVLKGFGLARGLTLEVGQVVNGAGDFAKAPIEWQSTYHPKAEVKT